MRRDTRLAPLPVGFDILIGATAIRGNEIKMIDSPENPRLVELPSLEEFYDSEGSQFLQLESKALEAHGDNQKKLIYELFGSVKTLVQTIGVVAGFGFTGLGLVKSVPLFVGGEFFFLAAIVVGLWWNHRAYVYNLTRSSGEKTRIKGLFGERFKYFKKVYDQTIAQTAEGPVLVPEKDMADLRKANSDLLEQFISGALGPSELADPFQWLMVLFAIGGVLVLASFTGHGAAWVADVRQWLS